MKKIFTFLLVLTAIFSTSSFAQLQCNAAFAFTVNGATGQVQFTPANTAGMAHNWQFGDGSFSDAIAPLHTYQPGTYMVIHVVTVRTPNDSTWCRDTAIRTLTIAGPLPCNINAAFSFVRDSIQTNKVYFTNLSSGINPNTITRWSFGDGTVAYDNNPTHIYQSSGAYTVCLLVRRDSACADDTCAIVQVQVPNNNCNLVPGFIFRADSTAGTPIPPMIFFNTSTPLTASDSSFWNFGDGTPVVINPANPVVHGYTAPGIYIVCLRVKKVQPGTINVICERQICQTIVVDTPHIQCNLQAYFTAQRDSTLYNKYHFTNLTQGLNNTDSVRWTFGDGASSADINDVHTYNAPGTYQVCLRVKRPQTAGVLPCVDEYCSAVVVQQPASCNLVVNFTDSVANNTVYFTNLSTPLAATDSIRWTFGDGSSSTDVNPVHSYNQPGSYTVCLRVKKSPTNSSIPCVREFCRIITILPAACNIVVNFTAVIDSLPANPGANYIFTNTTTGLSAADSSFWYFGDGTPVVYSSAATVRHTYTGFGTFNVCLKVKKMIPGSNTVACVREFCRAIVVQQPNNCNLIADFTYQSDSVNGSPGNVYQFTNISSPLNNIDSSFWNFGDGSPVVINPGSPVTHTYTNPGVYTVCLLVKKVIPGTTTILCERQICKVITVRGSTNICDELQVNFAWHIDSSNNRLVHFINQTNPVTANIFFNWNFGDGTSGLAYSPEHIYAHPGTYTVCLRAQMANCIKDTCKVIVIQGSPIDSCTIRPAFTTRIDSANRRKVYFSNTSFTPTSATGAVWHFGDGTTATSWNAEHEYAMPGRYQVCLTVMQGNTCTRTWCDSVFVPGNVIPPLDCDSFRLEFGYRRDNYMPNKLYFFAAGNAPVYNQQWTFTKTGSNNTTVTVNQNNPVYVFTDTGLYRVCVRGAFSNNCVKEYCNEVRIFRNTLPERCYLHSYPNPAHHHVSFNVQLAQPGPINTTVYNIYHTDMMSVTTQGVAGHNQVRLDIRDLPRGFYGVKIRYGNKVCHSRFIKF